MRLPLYQVDAFTSQRFSGNPAAVVFCDEALPSSLMQAIAAENNLAETAFVQETDAVRTIRWFTPTVEVDLCGHATLAAAHVLYENRGFDDPVLNFESRSGLLQVRRQNDLLWMNFPADTLTRIDAPAELVDGLGAPVQEVLQGRSDLLAVVDDEQVVTSLEPDLDLIARLAVRGLAVTAAGRKLDFVSRFFAPQSGIAEDAVTGSAHTSLVPYWAERLAKRSLRARQLSPRGGDLWCELQDERVEIGGKAVTFLVGEIRV